MLKSLDPRINRLEMDPHANPWQSKENLDQLETYEVFVQTKEDKPFEHAGIVHATSHQLAFVFAKEQYSRRGKTCTGIWIAKTADIKVTPFTDQGHNIYDQIVEINQNTISTEKTHQFYIFHLLKRGKQHIHAGIVQAINEQEALLQAKETIEHTKPILNIWVVPANKIFASEESWKDIWNTLHEKQYRDAIAYKASEKIKAFKQQKI